MEQKNFKKCHSRNLDQTDLILDFLSNLDKSKNSFAWRDELNQINQDWTHMMKEKNGDDEESGQEHQRRLHQDDPDPPLSPSKRVTWSDKLTNVKTISPPRPHQDHVSQIEIHHPRLLINPDCDQIRQNPVKRNIKYQYTPEGISDFRSSPQKHYHHHHHHHQPHHRNLQQFEPGRAAPKMRLISIVPNNL